jgi:signal transduction histidine kinase
MTPQFQGRACWKTFRLRELVEEVCRSSAALRGEPSIDLSIDIPADLTVSGDRKMLRRAIEYLIEGAAAAMPDGGALLATSATGPEGVELEIADTGPSLSDDDRRHVFDPSDTAPRGVVGWDMALVRHVAEVHGGSVTAVNCPEGGVALTLRIPRPKVLEAAA